MTGTGGTDALIERDAQVHALAAELRAAAAGDGGLTLIDGDAGIGKTRLLAALGAEAEAQGLRVLSARGSVLEQDFPFGVIRSLLGPAVRALEAPERAALLAGGAEPAGIALGFVTADGHAPVQPSPTLLDAVYWLVDGLCAAGPLVLAVDDLHWADAPSVRALAYVANRAGLLPLALVCAQRAGAEPQDPLAADGLRRVARTQITPPPLTAAGVRALTRGDGHQELDEDASTAVQLATRGNPFLVRQILEEVASHGTGALDSATGISATAVRGVVIGRLLRTPAAAQQVARAVAVLGDGAHVSHVAELTGLPATATLEAAAALAGAGLFDDDQRLAFAHPLLAEAVGSDIGAHEQALAHLRAAQLLRAAGAAPERIAVHLARSSPVGDPQAATDLRAAAREAMLRGAPEVAIAHLQRALAEPPAPEAVGATTIELGLAELSAGRLADAPGHLAGALTDPAVPIEHAASAAWSLVPQGGYPVVIDALLQAAAVRAADPDEALRLRGMAGFLNYFVPAPMRTPVDLPERAALPGRTPGQRMALAAHLAASTSDGTTAAEVADMSRRALADGLFCAEGGDHGVLLSTGPIMGLLYTECLDDAARESAHAERQSRETASGDSLGGALFPQTYLYLLRGDMAAAVAQAASALDVAMAYGGEARGAYEAFLKAILLLGVLAHEGPQAAVAALAEYGVDGELGPGQIWMLPVRAQVLLAAGRTDAALADAQAWAGVAAMMGDPLLPVEFHAAQPLALLAAGDAAGALEGAERVLARERAWGVPGRTAAALRTLAEVDPARGIDLLQEAVALADAAPLPLERARVHVAHGLALRRAGARTEAKAALQRGVQLAAGCQARPLRDRALEELRVLGARPRRLAFDGLESLTRSERRVVDLAAAGSTNREIAQQLFVSVKTVDSHLEHAYRKLGISSRKALPALLQGAGD